MMTLRCGFVFAWVLVGCASSVDGTGGSEGTTNPKPNPSSNPPSSNPAQQNPQQEQEAKPTYTTKLRRTIKLEPFTPEHGILPPLEPTAGPAPVVTVATPLAGPWGTKITITGVSFGAAGFVSFGKGDREIRANADSWTNTSITVTTPVGAEGEIAVRGRSGTAVAGTFTPPMTSRPPIVKYGLSNGGLRAPESIYHVASWVQGARVWVLTGTGEEGRSAKLFAVDKEHILSADLGLITSASARLIPNADGSLELVIAGGARLAHFRIRGNEIDDYEPVLPAGTALAAGTTATGLYVWTSAEDNETARMVLDRASLTWSMASSAKGSVLGYGYEQSDGTAVFAFGRNTGGGLFSDAKGRADFALVPATGSVKVTSLGPSVDDYVSADIFKLSSGLAVSWCNTDSSGGPFDDVGTERCVLQKNASGTGWTQATQTGGGTAFGQVADDIAMVKRVTGGLELVAAPTSTPLVLTTGNTNRYAHFPQAPVAKPTLVLDDRVGLIVADMP